MIAERIDLKSFSKMEIGFGKQFMKFDFVYI